MQDKTKDVETLLGNPKKAMLAMAIPIIISMLVQNANNLIDSVWVAGLGANALAAVGLVFPIFFIMISIGNGIGIGSSSAIARFLGMDDKGSAERTAAQAVVLGVIGGVMIAVILLLIREPLFEALGAGDALQDCLDYATPIFITCPLGILNGIISNLLRSEGASRKAMYSQVMAAVINMALDPFFIYDYGLGLGLAGAAWATALSFMMSLLLLCYWYWGKKSTFLRIRLKGFRFDPVLDKAIFRVGIPASIEMMVMSLSSMALNLVIINIAGTDGVAVFSSSWRIIQFAMIPIMGLGSAVVPVCAAAFGMRKYENIRTAYWYAIKVITVIVLIEAAIMALAADQLVMIFTYSENTEFLREDMAAGVRISCTFIIFVPWGFVSAGFFQSLGMGTKSLISSIFRNFLALPICYYLASNMEQFWWGVAASEIIGTAFIVIWGLTILRYVMQGVYRPDSGRMPQRD
ncbi:MAG: MATE family efflux transporter [Candidatus Methanomethylophilaceae archaeon]|nr:MATE family efflux transporter [Candidatus Methanomethylophilaceae archaeon]